MHGVARINLGKENSILLQMFRENVPTICSIMKALLSHRFGIFYKMTALPQSLAKKAICKNKRGQIYSTSCTHIDRNKHGFMFWTLSFYFPFLSCFSFIFYKVPFVK